MDMTVNEKTHDWLLRGIMASIGFTMFIAGWLWFGQSEIANDVDQLIEDVGYIKGVIANWETYPP